MISTICPACDLHTTALGHKTIRVGDSSWHSERIVKNLDLCFSMRLFLFLSSYQVWKKLVNKQPSLSFCSRRQCLGNAHMCSAPSLSSLPKVAPKTVPSVCLNTDHFQPQRVEYWPLPFFTPLSFRRSMLWCSGLSMFRKFHKPPSTCPAKLQTRCEICCAWQSICPFIPTDSGMPRAVDPQKSFQPKTVQGCVPVRAAHSRLHLLQQVHRVFENDGKCNLCITLGG